MSNPSDTIMVGYSPSTRYLQKSDTPFSAATAEALLAKAPELLALEAVDAELLALAAKDTELLALEAKDAELLALAAKDTELLAMETANAAGDMAGAYSSLNAVVKTADEAVVLLAAKAFARRFILHLIVDETFAAGDGAATVIKIGDGTTADLYLDKNTGSANDVVVLAGTLASGKALTLTPTAATGTGAGGVTVTVIAAA